MPPADRTHPVILDHLNAVIDALEAGGFTWPVGEWKRPEDLDSRFVEPPYALVRMFPSAGQFDGPLTDTQADVTLRVQVMGVGLTHGQALAVTDLCRTRMKTSIVQVPNRYVQSLQFMVVSGGVSRDDDLPLPFFNSSDLYELRTTPT